MLIARVGQSRHGSRSRPDSVFEEHRELLTFMTDLLAGNRLARPRSVDDPLRLALASLDACGSTSFNRMETPRTESVVLDLRLEMVELPASGREKSGSETSTCTSRLVQAHARG